MCNLPENLQIIKREPSPSSTPEEQSPNSSIKAKLNLHVKRRLQDINQSIEENAARANNKPPGNSSKQDKPKTETAIKQKRPYHKRTDKSKTVNTTLDNSLASTSVGIATTTPQRKYKHKIKQIVTNTAENQQDLVITNKTEEQTSTNQNSSITTGAISAGDDDEGGHENDLKTGREKEKCPDVLAMVLSVKKRALMQDPEVQKFLKDVMEALKS